MNQDSENNPFSIQFETQSEYSGLEIQISSENVPSNDLFPTEINPSNDLFPTEINPSNDLSPAETNPSNANQTPEEKKASKIQSPYYWLLCSFFYCCISPIWIGIGFGLKESCPKSCWSQPCTENGISYACTCYEGCNDKRSLIGYGWTGVAFLSCAVLTCLLTFLYVHLSPSKEEKKN